MVNFQNYIQWPRPPSKMTAISGHSFNIGPYGKYILKSSPLKPVSQFKAWMVLKWSIFKIVSGDPDLHPRWPPSADIPYFTDDRSIFFFPQHAGFDLSSTSTYTRMKLKKSGIPKKNLYKNDDFVYSSQYTFILLLVFFSE